MTGKQSGMVRRALRGALVAGLAGVLIAGTGGSPALAAGGAPGLAAGGSSALAADSVAVAKRATTARIDRRLAALRVMDTKIGSARRLTDAHRNALRAVIDADRAGLTNLRGQVQAASTVEAIKAYARDMVEDYRIYMLLRPQVHVCVAADVSTAALARLRQAYDKLSAGQPTGDAAEELAAMKANLDAAETALSGTADRLLAVKPGPDETAIRAQVSQARNNLHTARKNLRQAAAHAKRVNHLLRSTTGK